MLSDATKRQLARTAFAHTAAYDAAIVGWFDEVAGDPLPPTIHLALERVQDLRYGENPHQTGARYREVGTTSWWDGVEQHGGMALSYLNLFDADAAWGLANDLAATFGRAGRRHHQARQPVRRGRRRHAAPTPTSAPSSATSAPPSAASSPCRTRSTTPPSSAWSRPPRPTSSSRPGYGDGRDRGADRRSAGTPGCSPPTPPTPDAHQIRQLTGSWLVQDAHHFAATRDDWRVVTKREPTEAEWADAELAVAARRLGEEQLDRPREGRHRVGHRRRPAEPRRGGPDRRVQGGRPRRRAAPAPATPSTRSPTASRPPPTPAWPSSSSPAARVKDEDTIAKADELGLAMVFTGERHFLH